ncbi:MAG: hypothetical protein K0S32_1856 [Bacteroidetes bacterium]|nr:hypothetical protein [Bacteroidota bacterium]
MDLHSNPTETRMATVFLDKNDVVIITMKDCGVVDEYDLIDLNLVVKHKTDGRPSLKLFIADGNWDMNKKAKNYAKSQEKITQTIARAIVTSSRIKVALFNYMIKFNKKKSYPVQFFNNQDEAYAWLMSFKTSE